MTAPAAPSVMIAPSRVERLGVRMPQLRNCERAVHVYLPRGYDGGAAYPVLYLQDGQNLDAWRVQEALDELDVIVVGIASGPERWTEYGPWSNDAMSRWVGPEWSRDTEQGGAGDAYIAFVADTLKPMIDARYRTMPDMAHTGIGGSSMGALIALHAALTRPQLFGRVLAMSTATWFAEGGGGGAWMSDNRLLAAIRSAAIPRTLRFYVDVGTNERSRESDPDVVDDAGRRMTYPRIYLDGTARLVSALRAAGVDDARLRTVVDAGAEHHEPAWARRFPDAVRWLYAE